jgi:hypothetical protein
VQKDFCNKIGQNLTHAPQQTPPLFDHLVGQQLHRNRHIDAKRLTTSGAGACDVNQSARSAPSLMQLWEIYGWRPMKGSD